ncbi:GLPGLI family protein [Belliella sp. DSM 111904]|uniref:GLPGLI family protein n=1 Tax=Belliella filtrata TaxID=2923435 RepID=A0ABS9V5E6_9BACT|nr:GLPGLI family protein [Belliella filtrata]MCH7411631.1 GLPGLI family protein [Belliella filtrata]
MKKYAIVILLCAFWSFISNQNEEGVITYTTKINMHKKIPAENEEIKKIIPEFNTSSNVLLFNPDESLYKNIPEQVNPFEQSSKGNTRVISQVVMSNETYLDRKESLITQMKEFMGKKYLIKKDQERIPWKLGTDTKEIHGYTCKSASFQDKSEREIKAWFTEEIRVSLGPESYHGLPGLILEVSINDDDIIISTDKIEWRPLKKNEIKAPKNGQEISDQEYQAMIEDQMSKMGIESQGGNSGFRMMIRN